MDSLLCLVRKVYIKKIPADDRNISGDGVHFLGSPKTSE